MMPRASTLLTFAFGVVLLGAAGWTYQELLWAAFGSTEVGAAPAVHAFDGGGRIALLVSEHTASANAARAERGVQPAWLVANQDTWRAFLTSAGSSFTEVTDEDIESGRLSEFDLLVMPSASALSDHEITAIKTFLYDGGGVLASWTPGIFRPDGSWRGWSFIEETFGVQPTGFIEQAHANFRVYTDTFPGLAQPGLYRPLPADESRSGDRQARDDNPAGSAFAPLSGYRWSDHLRSERPADHFAIADTLSRLRQGQGGSIPEPATRIQFFTWLGGDPSVASEAAHAETAFGRVTLRAGTPLTAGVPAGFRMKTGTFDQPLQLRVVEPRTEAAAFWHDFAASDRPAGNAIENSSAIVYGTYGEGRFVYIGHELSAMGFDPVEQSVLAQVFENTLRWLRQSPLVWIETWPAPFRHAALAAGIAETDPIALEALLGPFREHQVPATFFLKADAAVGFPELTARLSERAELGLLADAPLPGPALRHMRSRFSESTGIAPVGFRLAQRRAVDAGTARALQDAGFAYVLPDTLGRAQQPHRPHDERLVSISRTARTDRDLLARTPAGSEEMRLALLRDDLARTEAEGGLYTFLIHDDALGSARHLPLVRQTLGLLRARDFWLPSGLQLAQWSLARSGLSAHVERRGPRRVRVRVSNDGAATAENAVVVVSLGGPIAEYAVRAELVGSPRPAAELSDDASRLLLTVDRLAPGQYRIYQIDLVPADRVVPEDAIAAGVSG